MSIIEAIIIGIIQGATEFLPISSSGHLVLLPELFRMTNPDLTLIGLVHAGTLLAVLIYFRQDLWEIVTAVLRDLSQHQPLASKEAKLGWLIVVGSIPVALIALPFADFFEEVFSSPRAAAAFLLLTAVLLVLGERALSGRKTIAEMTWTDTLIIGLFQTIALFPGVSRSGSTIVGGLSRGLDRPTAARFSFLLGIPAILGAGLQAILAIFTATSTEFSTAVYIVAFLAAALSGYACIHWLLTWVKNHTLYGFAIYVALFSIVFLLISFLGG
ncbi:MAG: undecaprenyl-diphosphate phosphatase [Ardenticatenaceae bacterium]|nr:undecaprenyl-diphosphate phosphatase [Ardenticatenaceae bacterium]MCB8947157.1 undecaprenyl-diphosphate phosphatase [Ardenticatenaceae bacterium]